MIKRLIFSPFDSIGKLPPLTALVEVAVAAVPYKPFLKK
jgi:hypothetical protein